MTEVGSKNDKASNGTGHLNSCSNNGSSSNYENLGQEIMINDNDLPF